MWSYQHQNFTVHQLPALRDNYIYLIDVHNSDLLMAVDPAEAVSVRSTCKTLNKPLTHILNTHHHWDHTDGNRPLKQQFACHIVGFSEDAARIPDIDTTVSAVSPPQFPGLKVDVIELPGHTIGHIAFLIDDALFCGDTLFGAGCGRLFEGTHEQMWDSLGKLAALDPATRVYCAHEYTLANLDFATSVDPDNPSLNARLSSARKLRHGGTPTIPSTIEMERSTNPFLRPLSATFCSEYAARRGISNSPLAAFTDLREARNHW